MVSNRVSESDKYGAPIKHNREPTGVIKDLTETVEDCNPPDKVTKCTGSERFCVEMVEITEEVPVI